MYSVRELGDEDLGLFIDFPYTIYDKSSPWVPPLKKEYRKYITGVSSAVTDVGPHAKLGVFKDGRLVGRLIVGVNEELNEAKGYHESYFSEFECEDDKEAASMLLHAAEEWAFRHGADTIKGPLALPGGDDNRGFLYENFEDPTYVMNVYNPPYYNDLAVAAGYGKYFDVYGFQSRMEDVNILRYQKLVPIAMERYGFTIENIRLDHLDEDMEALKIVMDKALPEDWADLIPPGEEELESIKKSIAPLCDPELIYIARDLDRNPIGFNITMPDYNQVLKKMYGKMGPIELLKFLYYKKKSDRARLFVLFVTPEYQKKGVTAAMYLRTYITAMRKGYRSMEGSTIWEYNTPMLTDIRAVGIEPYRTWRIYTKKLGQAREA